MLGLFGDHRLMWRQSKIVSAPSVFLQMVIFSSHLGVQSGLDIASESESLAGNRREFRETVSIGVPGILGGVLAEYCKAKLVVL